MLTGLSIPRLVIMTVFLAVAFVASACGVSKSKYKEQLSKVATLTKKLAKAEKAKADADAKLGKANEKLEGVKSRLSLTGDQLSRAKKSAKAKVKEFGAKLKATQRELEKLAKLRKQAEKRAKMMKKLNAAFTKLISAGKLSVRPVHGRLVLQLGSKVLFPSSAAKLRPAGEKALARIAKVLRKIRGRHFQVAGHTDSVPPSKKDKYKTNWDLSTARAMTVVNFLIKKRVRAKYLSVAGFSAYQPVANNRSRRGRALNRRIEITLMPIIPRKLMKLAGRKGRR